MHASVYLASRTVSAIVNAAAVVVFTRLAPAAVYGKYLIGFAICFIIYGLCLQWAVYAHFGNFNRRDADKLAGSLLVISAVVLVPALALIPVLVWLGALEAGTAGATAVLLVSFTLHFAALEIGRSHLLVGAVTGATLLRSLLALLFGALALLLFNTAAALLVAVGLAYAVGSLPVFLRLNRTIWLAGFIWPQRGELARMLSYGWPLIIAFGASAAALNIDRIVFERLQDAATVAPYGALLDFMKQTFLVVAEAIAVGYMSYARTLYTDGDVAAANGVLKRAFVTQCYVVTFGIVFFVLLGDTVVGTLLPPSYVPVALQILPILVVANAMLVLRAYHFGQVIYFSASSKLELAASVVMLIVAAAGSFLLIPPYGAVGAALAFTLGQAAALLVYLGSTPAALRLPVDWRRAAILALTGAGLIAVGLGLKALHLDALAAAINLVLISLASAYFLVRWNLFDARVIAQRMRAKLGSRLSAP